DINLANVAAAAVDLDPIAVVEPTRQRRNGDHRRNPQLARDDGGVREETAPLDEEAGSRRKDQNPPRVGVLRDQNRPRRQRHAPRTAHPPPRPPPPPGTTPQPLPRAPTVSLRSPRRDSRMPEVVPLIHDPVRLKPIVRRRPRQVSRKLLPPNPRQRPN